VVSISPFIVTIIAAWIAGQGTKYIITSAKHRSFNHFRQLYVSGSMPSAHTATVVSVVTLIGFTDGTHSSVFGLAALIAGIVMYDSVMVWRSSGEQGAAIQALIKEQKSSVLLPRSAKGHTPLEVLVGAILGALVGTIVFFATK